MKLIIYIVLLIILAVAMRTGVSAFLQTPVDKGNVTVYGSKTCPWCIKQEKYLMDKGIPYSFVDCRKQQCPEFVQGFPTIDLNGTITSGYSEI
jgi:hypothetical protein